MDPLEYCRSKAAPEGASLYYCLLFVPAEHLDALVALFALERELDEVVEHTSDAAVAMRKLEFWASELARLGEGARHPVSQLLERSGAAEHMAAIDRAGLIETTSERVRIAQVRTLEQLDALSDGSSGAIMALAARVLGCDEPLVQAARGLGSAGDSVRYVFPRARAGLPAHTAVPLELLSAHGVTPAEIDRGTQSSALDALRAALAAWARARLDRALERPAPSLARARARLAAAELRARLAGRPGVTPIGKLWTAWRASR